MSKTLRRSIFGVSTVIALTVLGGGFLPAGVRAGTQTDGAYRQMGVFEEVLHKIQDDYVVQPNIGDVTTGALHGLLESLDADSSYLTPDEYKTYKAHAGTGASGSPAATAQIGLNMSKRYGYATVVSVMPGSPADKQGITDGDLIESIDGQQTHDLSLAMIRLMLEGKPGTPVSVDVVRPRKDQPDTLKFTRAVVIAPALGEQDYENATILYLKPTVLTRERVTELEAKLRTAKSRKIILDLRDVSTGDEAQGIRLANAFIQQGKLASLEGQKFTAQTFNADPAAYVTGSPLAVLVNHGTCGAAEIVAAAVLDSKRGDVVGDRTFGEGAVEKTIELPSGAAIMLSIAKYESPSGKRIQDDAVTPNVTVGTSIDQYLAEAEDDDEDKPVPPVKPADDQQLQKAISLLKAKTA